MDKALLQVMILVLPYLSAAKTYTPQNDYPFLIANGSAPADGTATFLAANSHPDAAHTVSFNHFQSGLEDSGVVGKNWTWTVKTSNVSIANSSNTIPNAHVAYTTWSFSWPEEGDLNQALYQEGTSLESTVWTVTSTVPQKISKKWDSRSPDCTSALGEQCVQNLMNIETTSVPGGPLWKACAELLGKDDALVISQWPFGSSDQSAQNQTSLIKNETAWWALSAPYTPTNRTIFKQQAENLQIIVMTGARTNVLCNRAGNGRSSTSGSAVGPQWSLAGRFIVVVAMIVAITGGF